jgi:hypothetical protein
MNQGQETLVLGILKVEVVAPKLLRRELSFVHKGLGGERACVESESLFQQEVSRTFSVVLQKEDDRKRNDERERERERERDLDLPQEKEPLFERDFVVVKLNFLLLVFAPRIHDKDLFDEGLGAEGKRPKTRGIDRRSTPRNDLEPLFGSERLKDGLDLE